MRLVRLETVKLEIHSLEVSIDYWHNTTTSIEVVCVRRNVEGSKNKLELRVNVLQNGLSLSQVALELLLELVVGVTLEILSNSEDHNLLNFH